MYNEEYPDLIYEGLISSNFLEDSEILTEGINFSSIWNKLKKFAKKLFDKLIEKWNMLMNKIKVGLNKLKNKFNRKKDESNKSDQQSKNTTSNKTNSENNDDAEKENNETSDNNERKKEESEPIINLGKVKYKFKSSNYIKDFDDEYENISIYIDNIVDYLEKNTDEDAYNMSFDAVEGIATHADFPKSMEELKEKILDLSKNKESYTVDSGKEFDILMGCKPDKYKEITRKLQLVLNEANRKYEGDINGPDDYRKVLSTVSKYISYLINYASLILQQIGSFHLEFS